MMGRRGLRVASWAEGLSLITLVFAAMPLKYFFDLPVAVRIVGMVHGVLFIALGLVVIQARFGGELAGRKALALLLWSLVPFGFLAADRHLQAEGWNPQT